MKLLLVIKFFVIFLKMKGEIDSYTEKIGILYNEIKVRDKIIEDLEKNNNQNNKFWNWKF